MYEIGLSSCSKVIDGALMEEYAKNNIKHIEISENGYDGFDYANAAKLAAEYGINIWSFHLPFVPFETLDLSSLYKAKRDYTVDSLSEIIKRGAQIGADKFIIHPSGEPIDLSERGERIKYSRESISRLADVAEKCGGVMCVEDLPRTCIGHSIEEMQFLTAEDERLKICFDTNHITVEKPEEVIEALGEKIVTLHVSDFDFNDEKHWMPGEGDVNWKNVTAALEKIGYNGVWMYELGFKCPPTISRGRDLTAADFKRNAEEILTGKAPTVIFE